MSADEIETLAAAWLAGAGVLPPVQAPTTMARPARVLSTRSVLFMSCELSSW